MNKRFVCISYPEFDVLFSNEIIKGSGFSDKVSEIYKSGFVRFGVESYPLINTSVFESEIIDAPMESQIWAYVLLDKNDFPSLQNQFKDDSPCFALGTSTGRFFVSDESLSEFLIIEGKIGKCLQEFGFSAFKFTKENKIQYLVDLELLLNRIIGGKKND